MELFRFYIFTNCVWFRSLQMHIAHLGYRIDKVVGFWEMEVCEFRIHKGGGIVASNESFDVIYRQVAEAHVRVISQDIFGK